MAIKPCPFCGEKNNFNVQYGASDNKGTLANVICSTCGAIGPAAYIRDRSQTYLARIA